MRYSEGLRLPLRLGLVSALLIVLCGFLGCRSSEQEALKAAEDANTRATALNEKLNDLWHVYLTEDRETARHSLEEMISVIETADVSPRHHAHSLWLAYCRLYVLEASGGNDAVADAYLLKARYWLLRKAELAGASTQGAADDLRTFDGARLRDIVQEWDKRYTDGKGPRYARSP